MTADTTQTSAPKQRRSLTDERFWSKVDKAGECWLWTAYRGPRGYGDFCERHGRTVKASRYAYEYAFGPIPDGLFVCHRCDNPPCVRPDHLFLGTPMDNTMDSVRKGRNTHGNTHAFAKLTTDAAERIRVMYATGEWTQKRLGKLFGVTQRAVWQVLSGKTWRKSP